MPTAEIIAIGTELLLGEIQDTNTAYLARRLRDDGINLYRATIIGDNYQRIGNTIREACQRAEIVITTGGLGPTVDDPTRQAAAYAFDQELVFCPELWDQILNRYERYGRTPTENNKRQAYLPANAVAIENPVGTAPAFYIDTGKNVVISLPGVPREMETLFQDAVRPMLRERFHIQEILKAYVLHAAGAGESQIDEWIGDLETMDNPTVGLLAHPGIVDIRITARAHSLSEADKMLDQVAEIVRSRVGQAIFGADQDTLEQVLQQKLAANNTQLQLVIAGLADDLRYPINILGLPAEQFKICPQTDTFEMIKQDASQRFQEHPHDFVAGIWFQPGDVQQVLNLVLFSPKGEIEAKRSYGGPPQLGAAWAVANSLDFIRRNIA
jgi:competence/damage-inducible protein CinA-like protein